MVNTLAPCIFPFLFRNDPGIFRVKGLLTNLWRGGVTDVTNEPEGFVPMPDRRQGWSRTSRGSLANTIGIAVGPVTLFGMFWQGARWASNMESKLDQALSQGIVLSQVQKDLYILQMKFDNSQEQAAKVVDWLRSLSERVDGRPGPDPWKTTPKAATGGSMP